MIGLVQRVSEARVVVDGQVIGQIQKGLLLLLCAEQGDTFVNADKLLSKLLKLRIFSDDAGKMNRSLQDLDGNGLQGGLLIVSQFTLAADVSGGNRPSFTQAASPAEGQRLYDYFVTEAREAHPIVQTGQFPPAHNQSMNENKNDFAKLSLSASMLGNLEQLGYLQMTAIQAASLPVTLAGKDLIAQASTGSGKTAAFGIPLVEKILPADFAVQAMILCPTRELADQVSQEIRRLARAVGNVKVVTLCGGVALRGQVLSLEHGAHVVVGTPGRIMDHLERGSLKLKGLKTLVLDEADRMLDMGFFDDIATVARQCPQNRQTLLFSATYPEGIAKLATQFMKDPQTVKVETQHSANKIKQIFVQVKESERLHAVSMVLNHFRPISTLAFCNTKVQCRDLVAVLQAQGFSALALYGELEQRERDQVLIQFANRSCSVLVATDVAARGLDVAQLEAVINVDVTPDSEVHIHRIGRTGRADAEGLAVSLASMDEMGYVGKIEVLQGRESIWQELSTLAPAGKDMLVPAMATLQIVGGRKEKIRAGDVLGALTGEGGYTREQVGKINVNEYSTYVAVSREIAHEASDKLSRGKVKGKSVKVRLLEDASGTESE